MCVRVPVQTQRVVIETEELIALGEATGGGVVISLLGILELLRCLFSTSGDEEGIGL